MAAGHSNAVSPGSGFIPRFVTDRDDYARHCGLFAASLITAPEDGAPHIQTVWRGPEIAMRTAGILKPSQPAPRRAVCVHKPWDINLYLYRSGKDSFELCSTSTVALTVEHLANEVERYELGPNWQYPAQVAHYGTADALQYLGLVRPGKRMRSCAWSDGNRPQERRLGIEIHYNGKLVFWERFERPQRAWLIQRAQLRHTIPRGLNGPALRLIHGGKLEPKQE